MQTEPYKTADNEENSLLKVYLSHPESGKREFYPHHHTELEITLFLSGRGSYSVLDRTYTIDKNDIFMFSNDEIHKITNVEDGEPMEILNIHFAPRFVWESENGISAANALSAFWNRAKNFSHKLPKENPATEKIRRLILEIRDEWDKRDKDYIFFIRLDLLKILILVLRHYGFTVESENSDMIDRHHYKSVNNALDYIDRHFTEDISIKMLSELQNMTQNNFTNCFKRLNGITPCNYIMSKRINHAMKLLKSTDMGITEIAFSCGYNNTANFNKSFKKLIGKTPSEYKSCSMQQMEKTAFK